jgi:hypothetical protein
MNARRGMALLLACGVGSASCADFEGVVDPAFGLPDVVVDAPTLVRDVQPLLDRRCAFGGCHSVASQQGGLVLVAGASHGALVGVRSRLRPSETLVVPGDASRSWLLTLVAADDAARMGFARMPLAALPLTPNQVATIARWIDRGAPRE